MKNFISKNEDVRLRMRHPLYTECSKMLRDGTIDFALFTMCKKEDDINIIKLYNEKLVFLCTPGSTYKNNMHVDELPVEREIYIGRWNENGYNVEFVNWHKKHFGKGYPMIETVIVPVIGQYFTEPNVWGIFPISIAAPYLAQAVVEKREIRGIPSYRPMSLLTLKNKELSEETQLFLEEMRSTLSENPGFEYLGKP